MFAAHHRLANLVFILDLNGQQALGYTNDVIDLSPVGSRWRAFGWNVVERDGHYEPGLAKALLAWISEAGNRICSWRRPPSARACPSWSDRSSGTTGPCRKPSTARRSARSARRGPGVAADENAFAEALLEAAECEPRVLLLTGDLGFMVLEPFRERFPRRFFNVGVAEQNLVGLATGLAEAGSSPLSTRSPTLRCCAPSSSSATAPLLHRLPVRIVGIGGGFDYGSRRHAPRARGHRRAENIPGHDDRRPGQPGADKSRGSRPASPGRAGLLPPRQGRGRLTPGLAKLDPERVPTVRNGDDVLLLSLGGIAARRSKPPSTSRPRASPPRSRSSPASTPPPRQPCSSTSPAFRWSRRWRPTSRATASARSSPRSSRTTDFLPPVAHRRLHAPRQASGCLEHLKRQHGLDAQAIADRVLAAWVPRG